MFTALVQFVQEHIDDGAFASVMAQDNVKSTATSKSLDEIPHGRFFQFDAPREWQSLVNRESDEDTSCSDSDSTVQRYYKRYGHRFPANDLLKSQHCTILGEFTLLSWAGTFCVDCGAMIVCRKISNRNSVFVVIGLNDCPKAELDSWLVGYCSRVALLFQQTFPFAPLSNADVNEYLSLHVGNMTNARIRCIKCNALYTHVKCSNKNPCRRGHCSLKYTCRVERKVCLCVRRIYS